MTEIVIFDSKNLGIILVYTLTIVFRRHILPIPVVAYTELTLK